MLLVKSIMHSPTTINAEASVKQAAMLMADSEIGSLLIKEHGDIVGIVTERDMLKKVVAVGRDPNTTMVKEIMSKELRTLASTASVADAAEMLRKFHIRRLPIVEEGKIVGIVTARDIARSLPLAYVMKSGQKL